MLHSVTYTLSERVNYPNYYHLDSIRSIVQEYVVTWHITCLSARKMCHCDIIVCIERRCMATMAANERTSEGVEEEGEYHGTKRKGFKSALHLVALTPRSDLCPFTVLPCFVFEEQK